MADKNGNGNGEKTRGRKTKLTPERQAKIAALIANGNYIGTACKANGISQTTYECWMRQGSEATSGIYFEFLEAIKKAEGEAEAKAVLQVRLAGEQSWQAAMTWLERRHPDRWGRKERVEHSGKDGQAIKTEITVVSSEAKAMTEQIMNGEGT